MKSEMTRRRTARDVSGWPGGAYTYASFDNFLAAPDVPTGVHSITDGREIIDFHYSDTSAPSLAVLFHGAVKAKLIPDLHLPVFSGLKVPLGTQTDRLLFSDATMAVHQQLRLGWFCGTRSFNLAARIDQIIARIVHLKAYRRIVLMGGSQGGFAALRASRRLPGSVALVWNPQTRIEHFFYPTRVKDFARFCFAAPDYDMIPAALRQNREMDLTHSYAGAGGAENYVFYMQNRCDPEHTEGHALPFGSAFDQPVAPPQLGVQLFAPNVAFAFGDWVGGHSLPDRDSVTAIAGILLDDQLPLKTVFAEANFLSALPDSFFAQATPAERADLTSPSPLPTRPEPSLLHRPRCDAAETDFLMSAIQSVPDRRWYMEYGASGTAKIACSVGYRLISILDSDAQHIKRITAEFGPEKNVNFRPLHADIGQVDNLGFPTDLVGARRWPNYVMKPWYCPPQDSIAMPDFIFVNGTFRMACCLNAALRCALHPEWPRPVIVLRRDKPSGEQDAVLSSYFNIVKQQGTLLSLEVRRDLEVDLLLQELSIKIMNPV